MSFGKTAEREATICVAGEFEVDFASISVLQFSTIQVEFSQFADP